VSLQEIAKVNFKDFFEGQQFLHWRYYLANRRKDNPLVGTRNFLERSKRT
jgi:hypothetical protein